LHRRYTSLLIAACVAGVIGCGWLPRIAQGQGPLPTLLVELDAFSGRPNPQWELSGPLAAEFAARLRALPPAPDARFDHDGLGYRGFVVRATDGSLNGFDEVRLYRGAAFARAGGSAKTFSDTDRTLERRLLETARGRVPDTVLEYVEGEIKR
jgi:hypothetical protein